MHFQRCAAPSARLAAMMLLLPLAAFAGPAVAADDTGPPNVILVITDDQGYGDLGAHGNDVIETPHMDELHAESVRLTDYHVDPTCSPTRSALLTGRYSTRTGVWHTVMGRSLLDPDELTIAEALQAHGYATGMFGKWHLGDNPPCRPRDQGFGYSFIHGGGGVGQMPDYWGNDYFDDTYFRNGEPVEVDGYCTDVWFNDALRFIERNKDDPFFAYISTNAPHKPWHVPDRYERMYRDKGVEGGLAKFYGMLTSIDENLGRLREKLRNWGIAKETILIFTSDNGTAGGGFNAGMRGTKGSTYEGGHRVPFFIRWPGGGSAIEGGRDVDELTAHIDVLPTLLDLAGLDKPEGPPLDGRSLAPLILGQATAWPDRTLFVHSQRIEIPNRWRNTAVMTERWRLKGPNELYDLKNDPGQQNNVADEHPEVLKRLNKAYDGWWRSLEPKFDEYVRIHLGDPAENPTRLNSMDWHEPTRRLPPWNQRHIANGQICNGWWAVEVTQPGTYRFELRRWPKEADKEAIEATRAQLRIGDVRRRRSVEPDQPHAVFEAELEAGPAKLRTTLTTPNGETRGAYYVYAERID